MRSIYSLKYLTIFGLDDDDGCLWQQLPWGRCWQAAEQKPRLAASLHSWIFVICAPRTRLLGKLLLHTKVRKTQQNQSMANIMYTCPGEESSALQCALVTDVQFVLTMKLWIGQKYPKNTNF